MEHLTHKTYEQAERAAALDGLPPERALPPHIRSRILLCPSVATLRADPRLYDLYMRAWQPRYRDGRDYYAILRDFWMPTPRQPVRHWSAEHKAAGSASQKARRERERAGTGAVPT